jgi:hypothetical protein
MKPGDLVRISYAGKPYHPGRTGWSMSDDQGYPGLDGKLGISLYERPYETEAGTFWTLLVGGTKKKSICEAYL